MILKLSRLDSPDLIGAYILWFASFEYLYQLEIKSQNLSQDSMLNVESCTCKSVTFDLIWKIVKTFEIKWEKIYDFNPHVPISGKTQEKKW